jgi:hypothetical protein
MGDAVLIVVLIVIKDNGGRVVTTNHVGTAALGCPAEHRSADFGIDKTIRRASLDRTAEGGCPDVVRGYAA